MPDDTTRFPVCPHCGGTGHGPERYGNLANPVGMDTIMLRWTMKTCLARLRELAREYPETVMLTDAERFAGLPEEVQELAWKLRASSDGTYPMADGTVLQQRFAIMRWEVTFADGRHMRALRLGEAAEAIAADMEARRATDA
jgi:hypothetical protein